MTRWTKVLSPLPKSNPTVRAGNGTRTRDPNLGKVVLYQLSYSRIPHPEADSPLNPNYSRDVSRGTLPGILSTRRPADRSAAPDVPRQWRRGESNP